MGTMDGNKLRMKEILQSYGDRINTEPGMKNTPKRFLGYLNEFHNDINVKEILGVDFDSENYKGIVAQDNIPFRMVCEHHLLPAWGKAYIGYIPNEKVVGLSKLSRLVDAIGTERPSLQESICNRIMKALQYTLTPKGVIVVIKAQHSCMAIRGAKAPDVDTTTCMVSGLFKDNSVARKEFFELINLKAK